MMAPAVLLRAGRPTLALGSGGSNRIRTAVSQVLYRVLGRGQSIAEAVRSPRVHAEGDAVWFEREGLADSEAALEALRGEFREVFPFPNLAFFFGGVHTAGVDAEGHAHGVGDPRRGGAAIVL
jgi:gamma-glutamyltranspeptidase/glutathione hydrolase